MRVLLFTGKGGVGKTTLAAATAMRAAESGQRVFLLSTDAAHSVGDALGRRVGPQPVRVAAGVTAQEVSPLDALERSWGEIQAFLRGWLRDDADEIWSDELLVFPGLEELMALRAIREVESAGETDVCVVDCAPTGATLRMLRFPDALRLFMEHFFEWERRGARLVRPLLERLHAGAVPTDAIFDAFERLVGEVDDVRRILLDPERTSARLVVNPTRVVVDETRRTFAYLSLYGVATDAVLVNRKLPPEASGGYFARWAELEARVLEDIEASFPLPRLEVDLARGELSGPSDLAALGRALYGNLDPVARLTPQAPLRWEADPGRTRLCLLMPGVDKADLSIVARGADLVVRVRDVTRLVGLPDSVVGRPVKRARLRDEWLEVEFG